MKNRQLLLSMLTVGLALATAWAIRGRFGHEQGAAWAGVIGALALILVAKRNDWYAKAFRVALAAAFGWGISGVMSYGIIVGYGRGTDFVNVFYGLLMLFVLGLLYGFLGGGFVGLALLDSKNTKIKWHSLLAEMIAMGLLVYAVLINQLEWFMTPPRSEMWAACLGASIALGWFITRNQYHGVLKVAIWSAVGAGFGFAFGNFLQVLGSASGIHFNFWNVMEYSIGFFGGIGMAYGVFTSSWPVAEERVKPSSNIVPILLVVLFVPFVVWDQSFVTDRFDFIPESSGSANTIFFFKLIAIVAILAMTLFVLKRNSAMQRDNDRFVVVREFFLLYTSVYIFFSFLITGVLIHPAEQYLYIVNFIAILYLVPRANGSLYTNEYRPSKWVVTTVISIVVIAVLSLIAINSHDGMKGSQIRFGAKAVQP